MDNKFIKIIEDYQNCIKMPTCGDCKAWEGIEGSDTTWCEFLRKRDELLYNKISEALGR